MSRQQASMRGVEYEWYECEACGSALLSVGGGLWAYQKVTRPGKEELLRQPMTLAELRRLLPRPAAPMADTAALFTRRTTAPTPTPAPAPPPPGAAERVEMGARRREPARPAEPAAGSIAALRATLRSEEEAPPRAAIEEAREARPAVLPAPFIVAVIVLLVLLLVGLGLIVLVGFLPA